MSWPEQRIESWGDFIRVTEAQLVGPALAPFYLYRGQPRADFDLSPSVTRGPIRADPGRLLLIESMLLEEFMGQAHRFLPAAELPERSRLLDWWALMQHYSMPTRLLDWTFSPFVALYFAVSSSPDSDAAVWLFHRGSLDPSTEKGRPRDLAEAEANHGRVFLQPDAAEHLFIYGRLVRSDRMIIQQGVFTVSLQVSSEHSTVLDRLIVRDRSRHLCKIIVPGALKLTLLRHLRQVNIAPHALFPGLDGIGRSGWDLMQLELREASRA